MAIEIRTLSRRLLFVSMVDHGLLVILLAGWAKCFPPPHVRAGEDVTEVGGDGWGTGVVCEGVGGVYGVVVSEGRSWG